MKIGDLAQLAQCTVETIRYYEKEGLLPAPARTHANYRHYSDMHLERLRFIRNCRALDMAHAEIRTLLGLTDTASDSCDAANKLLDAHIEHIDRRIVELMQLKSQLVSILQQCQAEQQGEACGILHGLSELGTDTPRHRHTQLN